MRPPATPCVIICPCCRQEQALRARIARSRRNGPTRRPYLSTRAHTAPVLAVSYGGPVKCSLFMVGECVDIPAKSTVALQSPPSTARIPPCLDQSLQDAVDRRQALHVSPPLACGRCGVRPIRKRQRSFEARSKDRREDEQDRSRRPEFQQPILLGPEVSILLQRKFHAHRCSPAAELKVDSHAVLFRFHALSPGDGRIPRFGARRGFCFCPISCADTACRRLPRVPRPAMNEGRWRGSARAARVAGAARSRRRGHGPPWRAERTLADPRHWTTLAGKGEELREDGDAQSAVECRSGARRAPSRPRRGRLDRFLGGRYLCLTIPFASLLRGNVLPIVVDRNALVRIYGHANRLISYDARREVARITVSERKNEPFLIAQLLA